MGAPWLISSCPCCPNLALLFKWAHLQQIFRQALPTIAIKSQKSTNKKQPHCPHAYTLLLPLDGYPVPASSKKLLSPFSLEEYIDTTHKDGSRDSTMVVSQATTPQTLILGTLPGNTYHKNFRSQKRWIPQELQMSFKNKDITLLTKYHPFQLKYLPQV